MKRNTSSATDWIIIAIALAAFWPVGVFLLFGKLSDRKKPVKRTGYHQEYEYHYQKEDLKQRQKKSTAAGSGKKSPLLDSGKKMTVGGGIAAGLFGITFLTNLVESLSWGGLRYAWSELFFLLGLCAAGVGVMLAGLSRTRRGKRYQKYLNLIGSRKQIAVEALAKAAGEKKKTVYADLEDMLEDGLFPVGHLDRGRGLLVLSSDGLQEEAPEAPKKAREQTHAVLEEIRQVNDEIADPGMSAKIDRIGVITGKILDYQKKNPGRDSELRSFLDYYLPTTLKILRSYAQLEAQGIEGENIRAAKVRIEGMMDKVVEGFETQLDRLFQSDTMDITSDVDVLEQMLKKDGLSEDEGLTL